MKKASIELRTCISMAKKKLHLFQLILWNTDQIKWMKNDRVITHSYSLHSEIVSPHPVVMKLSNTINNSAASNFCLMDSILFEIMSCFIRTIVKYKDDLFAILEKLPLSCWRVNNEQPHARIQILFPAGPKDIYVLGRGGGKVDFR